MAAYLRRTLHEDQAGADCILTEFMANLDPMFPAFMQMLRARPGDDTAGVLYGQISTKCG